MIGVIIVFLGADGSGKTSVGDQLQEALFDKFAGVSRFHLRPKLFGRARVEGSIPVTSPHGKAPRGILLSLTKLAYFWMDYTLGYWLCVRPLKVRSHLVLFDRYYHDLLIDHKRYRYGAPDWLARLIGRTIPKPDLFLVLDAPAEIIHARKQEVTLDETKRQRDAYLQFARETANAIVLSTDQSLDDTVKDGTNAVLQYMQERQSTRMGVNVDR